MLLLSFNKCTEPLSTTEALNEALCEICLQGTHNLLYTTIKTLGCIIQNKWRKQKYKNQLDSVNSEPESYEERVKVF